jgi:hypothetical protein
MTRISVYLKSQTPTQHLPQHSTTNSWASLLLSTNTARKVEGGLQLLTNESWRAVKARLRAVSSDTPQLNPPGYYVMCYQAYPPTPRSAKERELQAELWMTRNSDGRFRFEGAQL